MLEGGAFGPNLAASFNIQVAGNVLTVRENGSVLGNRKWYSIMNDGSWAGVPPFEVEFPVQRGDANNSGFVNFADLGTVNTSIPSFPVLPADLERRDIDGNGLINFADLAVANVNIGSLTVPKPGGH